MSKSTQGSKVLGGGCRAASACVAALAVLTAAGEARAMTTVTVPSTGWSRSYANSSWSQASSDLGTFGAGVSYNTTLSSDGQGAVRSTDNTANLDVELFGQSFTFAGVEGKLTTASATDTSPSEYLGATVGGFTLLSQTVWNTQTSSVGASVLLGKIDLEGAEVDLNVTGSYSFTGFSVCLEAAASTSGFIGPIPITVSGALDGCPYMSVPTATAGNTNGSPQLSYDMKPGIDTSFTLSAGLGSSDFASFGVYGTANIVNYGTDMNSSMSFAPSSSALSYSLLGVESLSSLSGSFGAYVTVGISIFSATYQQTLFSWNGISWQSQYVLADSIPTASQVEVAIGMTTATGSYAFADGDNMSDSGSTVQWYEASDSSGTGAVALSQQGSVYGYGGGANSGKFLRFCVTPRNSVGNWGTQSCSTWTPVGSTLTLTSGAFTSTFAYEKSGSTSMCVSGGGIDPSFHFNAPSEYSATLWLFDGVNCSGNMKSASAAMNSSSSGSWNDTVWSFLVVWNETVTASNLSVGISGNTATAQYAFWDSAGTPESGSTYQWYRAVDSTGKSNESISGATGKTYTLTPTDEGMFLMVCTTPSTGYLTGAQVCTDWSAGTGDFLHVYQNYGFTGSSVSLAYEHSPSGTCFNLSDYSFNDAMSSYSWADAWTGKAGATVTFYMNDYCQGSTFSSSIPAGGARDAEEVPSGWNDQVSSVAVTWAPTVTISAPTVTLSGDKATSSYTFSDTAGGTDQSTYQWYVASDGSGTGSALVPNVYGRNYTLTGKENNQYLQLCVSPSDGISAGTRRCSSWVPVGYEVRFFSEASLSSASGTSLAFAYQQTPAGTCFNMSDYAFDDVTRAFELFSSTSASTKIVVYQVADCVRDDSAGEYGVTFTTNTATNYTVPGGTVVSGSGVLYSNQLGSRYSSTISSFKVVY